jgi:hypothetical protein
LLDECAITVVDPTPATTTIHERLPFDLTNKTTSALQQAAPASSSTMHTASHTHHLPLAVCNYSLPVAAPTISD